MKTSKPLRLKLAAVFAFSVFASPAMANYMMPMCPNCSPPPVHERVENPSQVDQAASMDDTFFDALRRLFLGEQSD